MLDPVLCSSRCLCFVSDPMFFSMCSFQIYVLFVLARVEISLFNSGILDLVTCFCLSSLCVLFCCVCLVCVMYVYRWLYFGEGVFCVLCEFVPVCLPVVSV